MTPSGERFSGTSTPRSTSWSRRGSSTSRARGTPLPRCTDPWTRPALPGVAPDVCDDAAILGFLQRGRRVRFVEDASRGLDEARVAACTAVWRERGVAFTTAEEVVASLG